MNGKKPNQNDNYYNQQMGLSGMNSFDGDSLPSYSEFDSESVNLEYFKER